VLGDDTWGSLFPSSFAVKHLFNSFNTKDLDTGRGHGNDIDNDDVIIDYNDDYDDDDIL